MKDIAISDRFEKDWKTLAKKRYNYDELNAVLEYLEKGEALPRKYKDHSLRGDLQGYRECHIRENWLLMYSTDKQNVILERTGSHDELYRRGKR
ncbi:MAG: type II toxin-antitoxin system YafQ family toxin [Chitinivibrionia bacterium]|nr:type II toxin-antitoxin system YafQ family toxin [Chitinivibrionia bacterium]